MASFRVPFPKDPTERETVFLRAAALLERHGSYQGTPEAGTFQGRTPVGRFAGSYRTCVQTGTLEITLTKKPVFVPTAFIERELRRLLAHIA